MSTTTNKKIRKRILSEAKRRDLIVKLKHTSFKKGMQSNRKETHLDLNNVLDYKNTLLLRRLISTQGRILPRRVTGLTAKQQRQLARSVKRSREMCLIAVVRRRGGQK
uniref:Small ribosomal subunit protein bS18c n=1 Tax=Chloropicon maureeniae TaxID=1461542 RepID=A0A4D6C5C1_9CHLO|nr:ribosomal protein S18 [Chloropicon maureeniae]QBX98219.1 ribosomal protein S18 [Chloropicon maureeniae]